MMKPSTIYISNTTTGFLIFIVFAYKINYFKLLIKIFVKRIKKNGFDLG